MGKTIWSSSRISTFVGCPLRYKLQYVEKWEPEQQLGNDELARKGTVFHKTAEDYQIGEPTRSVISRLRKNAEKLSIDLNKYPLEKNISRFIEFWNYEVAPKEKAGYKISKENVIYGKIGQANFMGIFDLVLESENEIIILDYKTGKKPSVSSYKNQLILYAYLAGSKRGWDYQQIAEKIRLKLFFPLNEEINETDDLRSQMLKSLKEIKFSAEDLKSVIDDYYQVNLDRISAIDWTSEIEGTLSFGCSWCQYLSAPKDGEFSGCSCSREAGLEQPIPGVKFLKKEKK